MQLRTHAGFRLFWTASTVSEFGSYVTTLAIQFLIVRDLAGTATDVGLVNAARWLPYLLFGVLVGALADRVRRKPLLVGTDLGRAALLCAVPLLAWPDRLSVPVLCGLMAVFGLLSLANDAAHQSFLPRLLPRSALTRANARLDQGSAVAQTSGPAVAGGLVGWLGAPLAVLVDSASYLVSGLLVARTRLDDPAPPKTGRAPLRREMREGLAWVYGHRMLRPLALTTHGWFLFFAILGAVYVPYVLTVLDFSALALGLTFTASGVGALLGSSMSLRLGRWPGLVVPATYLLQGVGVGVIALADGPVLAGIGQFLVGFGMGLDNPLSLAYRQRVTPDRLQARMNATMRSINRAAVVVGAPLGGLAADRIGHRPALAICATGLAACGLLLFASPFRHAGPVDEDP
jgi:MFS family permease